MMDRLHLGMSRQISHDLLSVFHMPFYTEGQGLQSLEQQEGVEG